MAQTVAQALKAAQLYSDDHLYTMLALPPRAVLAAARVVSQIGEPFAALIVDKDEVTLVIPADVLPDFARQLPHHRASAEQYRLITLDVVLEPTLVGFMARIASALADAGVSVMPFAAANRDHLLVPAAQFETAMRALKGLQAAS